MGRTRQFWLVKSEPESYSIDDLERDGTTSWEGVRNYQARNTLRDSMKVGDRVLFYASNTEATGVVGIAEVARDGYPDHFAFDETHHYYDPKSKPESPTWFMVDLKFVAKFPIVVGLATLRTTPGLEKMVVLQKGSRLSVQPVTKEEFEIVAALGGRPTPKRGR